MKRRARKMPDLTYGMNRRILVTADIKRIRKRIDRINAYAKKEAESWFEETEAKSEQARDSEDVQQVEERSEQS